MHPDDSGSASPAAASSRRTKTRSSLACLPCRSRHMKCDGNRPRCNRCVAIDRQCDYAQSRRGGLSRAALAERRMQLSVAEANGTASSATGNSTLHISSGLQQGRESTLVRLAGDIAEDAFGDDYDVAYETYGLMSPPSGQKPASESIDSDVLVDSYYANLHKFHPFALPRKHLAKLCQDPSRQISFKPLIAVMRLIGHIYNAREWSTALQGHLEACFLEAQSVDPFMVQCKLLYSIALFWNDKKDDAKREMDFAINLAFDLQMFRKEFAAEHGAQDPVLAECWRRTWWTLYIVDSYYAGTLGTMNFACMDVEATTDLPCEESKYESGDIPEPQTLQDFNCRDLSPETLEFSSFAYLIGAVQCAASAISVAPKVAAKSDSQHVIQAADSIVNGWLLLLPKDRNQVMNKAGEIDELMFQAHMVVHVSIVGFHRPLSDLKFNAVESVSSCAREAPAENPVPELINIHTLRVLRSVEAQIRLLVLPVEQFHHSPFTTCMVSEGTLALLSACQFILKDRELAIARDQIRMTIGCLKMLGEIWQRTARNVREIQTIARHVLGFGSKTSTQSCTPASSEPLSLWSDQGQSGFGPEADTLVGDADGLFPYVSIEDLCGWYNVKSTS